MQILVIQSHYFTVQIRLKTFNLSSGIDFFTYLFPTHNAALKLSNTSSNTKVIKRHFFSLKLLALSNLLIIGRNLYSPTVLPYLKWLRSIFIHRCTLQIICQNSPLISSQRWHFLLSAHEAHQGIQSFCCFKSVEWR